jgi:LEA14-like dessication related protein
MLLRHVMLWMGAALTLAGCGGGGPKLLEPQVELRQVVVRSVGLTGGALDLVVDVQNPNDVGLRVVGVDAGFDVEGRTVGEIRSSDITDLPGRGTARVTLPLRFDWSGAGDAFRTAIGYGELPFRLRGQLRFASGDRIIAFPFTREGRVPLSRNVSIPLGLPR